MAKIIDSAGKGSAITAAEHDSNLSTLAGKNQSVVATTHTIDVDDQGETIEYSNASPIAVTLPAISTVSGSNIHTDDFTVTLKNIGAGLVTVTRGGTDTFEDGSTSLELNQYEWVTIQTDSTLGKWNIISHARIWPNNRVTGTITVSSLAAATNSSVQTITHGLGTDDVDFGATVFTSSVITTFGHHATAVICGTDKRVGIFGGHFYQASGVVFAAAPSSGDLSCIVRHDGTGSLDVTVKWWVQKR